MFIVIHVSVSQERNYSNQVRKFKVISKFEAFVNQNERGIGVATCGERWRCKTGVTPDHFPTDNTQLCGPGSDKRRDEGRVTAERQ